MGCRGHTKLGPHPLPSIQINMEWLYLYFYLFEAKNAPPLLPLKPVKASRTHVISFTLMYMLRGGWISYIHLP